MIEWNINERIGTLEAPVNALEACKEDRVPFRQNELRALGEAMLVQCRINLG